MRRIVIGLIATVAVLLAADRISLYVAERAAAKTIQNSEHLDSRPDVHVGGFPFLTQLATGKYDEITITATDVPVGGKSKLLEISEVEVVLHTLTVSRSFSHFHAERADATGLVTYAELSTALGVDVVYAGQGRVRATNSVNIAGTRVHATVTARPRLTGTSLSFVGTSVQNAGELGELATATLNRVFDVHIPLRAIPFHVRVTSLHADERGIEISLTGRNLSYTS
jgi:LmeA-like phospholipid-binding